MEIEVRVEIRLYFDFLFSFWITGIIIFCMQLILCHTNAGYSLLPHHTEAN